MSVSVSLSVYAYVRLPCLPASWPVCLSVCAPTNSACVCITISVCIHLSSLPACQPACVFVCLCTDKWCMCLYQYHYQCMHTSVFLACLPAGLCVLSVCALTNSACVCITISVCICLSSLPDCQPASLFVYLCTNKQCMCLYHYQRMHTSVFLACLPAGLCVCLHCLPVLSVDTWVWVCVHGFCCM